MSAVTITRFAGEHPGPIVDLILPIQREEFGLKVTIDDQPDLLMIADFYQVDGGDFWLARVDGHIVGTIALKAFGGEGALRKMFVAAPYRGRPCGLADRLLSTLLGHARQRGMTAITLGTTHLMRSAHRFYERHGFVSIDPDRLPTGFPRMPVDNRFYRLALR